ncbi:efflux RND transporter permease subunit [Halodesulfovibrio marinisediminis]|uniref:Multidrug efflux pump subunit AcrB n=1 Tax=Halodesulfovibrio marinisediminis DSM 17456 TaxID=1121457 RepID=A0A1N6IIJ7_9BACT|nr:efflux RND transporter permease subunit [Halodesulfovibrio marinisediminis]SIO31803.1 Multidrug efflux pump subunit AcrB [Halodesulfovibrio marinisediminis DSM 17456]
MSLGEWAIRKRVTTLTMTVILIVGGLFAYQSMGRLEDPEFTIKEALVITTYPGATAEEVTEEVTDRLESEIQQLGQLEKIKSVSTPGKSIITVEIKENYDKNTLPQVWDELRRKVGDAQANLPPGANSSVVVDDFGDVYGILYSVTADGYSYKELQDYVTFLRKELLLIPDVAKVTVWGEQQEAVFVEIPRAKLRQLGVTVKSVLDALKQRNLVSDAGNAHVGPEYIRIHPSGGITSVEDLGDIYVTDEGSGKLVYLSDLATITRGYIEPSKKIMRQDSTRALAVGISLASGGNIVDLGDRVTKRIAELDGSTPVGFEIKPVYFQPDYVTKAVDGFAVSLLEAVGIVIVILMIFMGLRSGLLIGAVLLITVCGSFIFMKMMDIQLQRISLGALIIALGMLVDNAIVVTEGMLIRIQQGEDKIAAARAVVAQTMWPLLGATVVAVMAFAAIGLSSDSTGEYCGSLFWVLLISLMLSWVTALTITPLLCEMFLHKGDGDGDADPYGSKLFRAYRGCLRACLNHRWVTVGALLALMFTSGYAMKYVDQMFFPASTQPQFFIDMWKPEGSDISAVSEDLKILEKKLAEDDRVEFTTTFVGSGAPRFMLVYAPEKEYPNYGQVIVTIKDYHDVPVMIEEYRNYTSQTFPEAFFKFKKVRLGPGRDDPIEVRFSGPDLEVLRALSLEAQNIFSENDNARGVRDDWRQKSKVIVPVLNEQAVRRAGLDRPDIANALKAAYVGMPVGVYREGDTLLPIVMRPPEEERSDVGSMNSVQVFSNVSNSMVPLGQLVSEVKTEFKNNSLHRRNRKLTITVSCEAKVGQPTTLFKELRPQIESMKLPAGYTMEWGGEYEDSTDAQAGLFATIPVTIVLMIIITIALFNALREPLIIWLTVPLAIIGVAWGLLAAGQPFGFMALLGFLSLMGMLIKNAIVLLDEINLQIREGKEPFTAVLDASVSRVRPVMMAASTTVLGMLPLLGDAFFVSMAVTIMAGLTFATVLTLIVVPTLYVILFKIREQAA